MQPSKRKVDSGASTTTRRSARFWSHSSKGYKRAVVHVGKALVAYRSAKIEDLRIQMKAAVAVEDYEQAARLRDLIRQQEAEGTSG